MLYNRSSLVLFILLDFLIDSSLFLPFLLSSSLPVDSLDALPKPKLKPVENEEDGKDKLNKAEGESDASNGKSGVVLCLKVLNVDLVEISNEKANNDRKVAGNLNAFFHLAFSQPLLQLQLITVLHLLLQPVSIPQKGHYLVPVRISGHLKHNLVSKVACQTVENRELGEEHSLVFALVVGHLNADEQTFQVGKQTLVLLHPSLNFLVQDILNHFGRMAFILQLTVVFLFDDPGNPHLLILS